MISFPFWKLNSLLLLATTVKQLQMYLNTLWTFGSWSGDEIQYDRCISKTDQKVLDLLGCLIWSIRWLLFLHLHKAAKVISLKQPWKASVSHLTKTEMSVWALKQFFFQCVAFKNPHSFRNVANQLNRHAFGLWMETEVPTEVCARGEHANCMQKGHSQEMKLQPSCCEATALNSCLLVLLVHLWIYFK